MTDNAHGPIFPPSRLNNLSAQDKDQNPFNISQPPLKKKPSKLDQVLEILNQMDEIDKELGIPSNKMNLRRSPTEAEDVSKAPQDD